MKRIFAVMVAMLLLSVSGQSLAAENSPKVLKIAMVAGANSPEDAIATSFMKTMKVLHPTKVRVEVYPGETLGSVLEMVDGLRAGSIEMSIDDTAAYARFFDPLLIFSMPYVFDDVEQFFKALQSDVWKQAADKMAEETGLRIIGIVPRAPRTISTTKLIIKSPEDMLGMKIRVPEVREWSEIYKALGTKPTPISYGELYMALKMGVAEGQENPPVNIFNMKFYEVQKYLIGTGPMFSSSAIVINEKVFESLPNEVKADILKAGQIAAQYGTELDKLADISSRQYLTGPGGMTYIEVDEVPFREKTKDVYKKFLKGEFTDEFYHQLRKAAGTE